MELGTNAGNRTRDAGEEILHTIKWIFPSAGDKKVKEPTWLAFHETDGYCSLMNLFIYYFYPLTWTPIKSNAEIKFKVVIKILITVSSLSGLRTTKTPNNSLYNSLYFHWTKHCTHNFDSKITTNFAIFWYYRDSRKPYLRCLQITRFKGDRVFFITNNSNLWHLIFIFIYLPGNWLMIY